MNIEKYIDRKIRSLNIHQLAKLARRIPRRARKLAKLIKGLHPTSRFLEPLKRDSWTLNLKQSIVIDEAIRRNALAAK